MAVKKKEIRTGIIQKTVFGGDGLIKIDDFTILIKNGIEGQEVEYKILRVKKNYAQAEIVNIIKNSSLEIPKSEQKNTLPGCTYQNISYENQLNIKYSQLKEIFRNFEDIELPKMIPSPKIFEYRNKIEFSCGYETMDCEIIDGKKIWKDEGFALGFHPPKSWARVISIHDVFIASKDVNILRREIEKYLSLSSRTGVTGISDNSKISEVNFLKNDSESKNIRDLKREPLSPWNPLNNSGFWRGVIFRHSEKSGEITVNFVVSEEKEKKFWEKIIEFLLSLTLLEYKISGIFQTVHTGKSDAIVNPQVRVVWGKEILEEELSYIENGEKKENFEFDISPFSFFQTNTRGAEILYSTVRQNIGETHGKNVLDLFCGTGSIGIFCAKDAKKVVGIELVEEAVEMAKVNAKKNGIENAEFFAGKAEKILPEILEKFSFDTVIIDPPRAGIHPKALQYIANLPVKKMVYVSCNPTTLARDALSLSQCRGWKLTKVQGVDMFAHTPHMEVVSVLERD